MLFYRTTISNRKHFVVKMLLSLVLSGIVVNQIVWLNNMYSLLQREYEINMNAALHESIYTELNIRVENIGGFSLYSPILNNINDTSRFFKKNIVTEDSTYTFVLDKYDSNSMSKISQFVLKKHLPVDLIQLTNIFHKSIPENYEISSAHFDYINLDQDKLIESNRPDNFILDRYISTDTFSIDVANSLGIVGYTEHPHWIILDKMKNQLGVSVLLIVIAVVSLIYVFRSFILQWNTEKMRQESVNAMTHEFKRPISSAVATASIIPIYLKNKEHGKVLEYVAKLETELNKLTFYTKRIQHISNNDKNNLDLDIKEVEIIPFFESLIQRYIVAEQNKRRATLNLNMKTAKRIMHVDLLHFSNVMDNLVENAIKYTIASNTIVEIEVKDIADSGMEISVQDNGIGISPRDIKYVFDKFYRVKREESKYEMGFGLGLTYVKSIIDAHGGTISVYSSLNEGSKFIIQLKN